MTALVQASGLTRRYANGVRALDRVDLTIKPGEILALLGPNGAGKSTLIDILCGLQPASAGEAFIGGHPVGSMEARRMTGLVPQDFALDPLASVQDAVQFSRGLLGLAPDSDRIQTVLDALGLSQIAKARIGVLSGGQNRRVLIAKALAHAPKLLFLDEPTAGVDADMRRDIWAYLLRLRAEGMTIVLTTHYLEEAERLADRIGLLKDGRLFLIDDTQRIFDRLGMTECVMGLHDPITPFPNALRRFSPVSTDEGRTLTCALMGRDTQGQAADLIQTLVASGARLQSLHLRAASLEEIIHWLFGQYR